MDISTTRQGPSTVKVLTSRNMTQDDMIFIAAVGRHLAKRYGSLFDPDKFRLILYADYGRITIAHDGNGRATGLMLARLFKSVFDGTTVVYKQDLLYGRPGSRAVKLLLEDFIDFGRANADHVITCIGEHTCIKESSLEKLGFSKLETLYRMEIK